MSRDVNTEDWFQLQQAACSQQSKLPGWLYPLYLLQTKAGRDNPAARQSQWWAIVGWKGLWLLALNHTKPHWDAVKMPRAWALLGQGNTSPQFLQSALPLFITDIILQGPCSDLRSYAAFLSRWWLLSHLLCTSRQFCLLPGLEQTFLTLGPSILHPTSAFCSTAPLREVIWGANNCLPVAQGANLCW